MTTATTPGELAQFAQSVTAALGLSLNEVPEASLAQVVHDRAAAHGWPVWRYVAWLAGSPSEYELGWLACHLTVSETFFFRDMGQLDAFTELVIPERMRERSRFCDPRLRLLSAGCSTGEEPYTLAMLLHTIEGLDDWDTAICGVDVNAAALERATQARYSAWSLRATPPQMRARWFRAVGADFVLDEQIRQAVTFGVSNLADGGGGSDTGEYDVIFCRNMVMYLTVDARSAVISRLERALVPGGFLFLGHAENLRDSPSDLQLRSTDNAFFYQKPDGGTLRREPAVPVARGGPTTPDEDWIAGIGAATGRIAALTAAAPGLHRQRQQPDLTAPLSLFQAERFGEALHAIHALPAPAAASTEALVFEAVVHSAVGEYAAAEAVCRAILTQDPANAGAHYVLAACCEALGDEPGAVRHNRTAAHLDPGFGMPRLHLGVLARRAGDLGMARREFAQAITLIIRESADRIVLFGGGFTRAALLKLCRAELVSCGGTP